MIINANSTCSLLFGLLLLITLITGPPVWAVSSPATPQKSVVEDANRPILPLLATTTSLPTYFSWNMHEYPNPQTNPKFCNRSSPSLLCDVDHLLTGEQANRLEQLMAQTSSNVSRCYCKECPAGGVGVHGIQLAIALVRHIFRPYNSLQSTSQEFANHLRTEWKFGACGNTVLILLVADADEITLSVGAIAEAVFDDKFFDSLINAHRNEFEAGRLYEGLVAIIGGMRHHMVSSKAPANLDHDALMTRTGPGNPQQQPAGRSTTATAVAVVGIIVGFLLVILFLTGTILLAKRRLESEPTTEENPKPKPEGYWSGSPNQVDDDDDNDDDSPPGIIGTDQVDGTQSPPPLPSTPPPSTPSQSSLANRKLSTPSGVVVEYEPVSIEEDDHHQRRSGPEEETAAAEEIGQEELLEASSRISTPEVHRHSRL